MRTSVGSRGLCILKAAALEEDAAVGVDVVVHHLQAVGIRDPFFETGKALGLLYLGAGVLGVVGVDGSSVTAPPFHCDITTLSM